MKLFLMTVVTAMTFGQAFAAKTQSIMVDGSSTVYPLSEAVAEQFKSLKENQKVRLGVGLSGTGGGMKKFCNGEIDITGASRPIKESEIKLCAEAKVAYVELPVAYDGLAVVINKENTWATHLTIEELKKIWEPESKITHWNQVRKDFPNEKIYLFGPGPDSGTFDYFTEKVVGKERASRADYSASEDDNMLVTGVSDKKGALGYFGLAYYLENKDKLGIVAIKTNAEPVLPTPETVQSGTYAPLSRPIYIYISKASLKNNPLLKTFAEYYLKNSASLSADVGYVALQPEKYAQALKTLEAVLTP